MIGFLRRNWEYKLLSLALSVLLYFIASGQRNPNRSITISVQPEVVGLPENLAVRTPPKSELITLTGPAAELEIVRKAGVRTRMAGTGARPGKNFLAVQYELPTAVRNRVEVEAPPTLEVELEERKERTVPVRVLFEDQPPPGYEFEVPTTLPARVTVTGLASDVERVARVVAFLDNTLGAVDREVSVVAQDEKEQVLSTVTLKPARVRVSLTTRKAPATKALLLSPQLIGTPALGARLTDYRFTPATVTVRGETASLAALTALTVPVSVEGLARSETRSLTLTPPPGVNLVPGQVVRLALIVQEGTPPTPSPTPKP